jgi:uncharacterized protein
MPKVTHFEILGSDARKSRDFYTGLFGWTIDANNPLNYGSVAPVGNGIGGGVAAVQPGASPRVTVYVEVDAIQPYLDKVAKLGGKVVLERSVVPGVVTLAFFEDPDGNAIGLRETEVPTAG